MLYGLIVFIFLLLAWGLYTYGKNRDQNEVSVRTPKDTNHPSYNDLGGQNKGRKKPTNKVRQSKKTTAPKTTSNESVQEKTLNESLSPHVSDIKRALNGKLSQEQIEEELYTYTERYGVPLGGAKRSIVKKYDGDPQELYISTEKKIEDIEGDEQELNIKCSVVSIREKEVKVDGQRKQIWKGELGDETGTVDYTLWEDKSIELEKGDSIKLENAYVKMWNEKPQVNIGSKATIKKIDEKEVPYSQKTYENKEKKIEDINSDESGLNLKCRIVSINEREVEVDDRAKQVWKGSLKDNTGTIDYTLWNPKSIDLKKGDFIKIENVYTNEWNNLPQININNKSSIKKIEIEELEHPKVKKSMRKAKKLAREHRCKKCGSKIEERYECCYSCNKKGERKWIDKGFFMIDYVPKGNKKFEELPFASRELLNFRYGKIKESFLLEFCEKIIEEYYTELSSVDCIIPIPEKKDKDPDFRPPNKIGKKLEEVIGTSLRKNALKFIKKIKDQKDCDDKEERKKNVKGALSINEPIQCEKALIVDDVFTTGSTVNEAAKVLKQNGVETVYVFCLGRTDGSANSEED